MIDSASFLVSSAGLVVLLLVMSSYRQLTAVPNRAWKAALAAALVFVGSAAIATHADLACMKRGCFYVLHLPFHLDVTFRHPYDYYILNRLVGILLLSSMLMFVICLVAYFCKRGVYSKIPRGS